MTKPIYLDYAAATPLDTEVLAVMKPYFVDKFYNPSATYLAARDIKQDLNRARSQVAMALGAQPGEVVFTAGATEANNLAIGGVMRQYPDAEVLVSSIEHESVLAPAEQFKSHRIPVTKQGIIETQKLRSMISNQTVLVSVMLVNNELGTVQPLKDISKIISAERDSRLKAGNKLPLLLHTDAAQAANYLDLHVARLGVDLLSINGGKIYGPKQSGVLYVRAGVTIRPLIVGGGQEHGLRSGTENVASIVGLAKALDTAQAKRAVEARRITGLRELFAGLIKEKFPKAVVNGASNHLAPHILSVCFAGKDNERLMMELDELGVICAVGSACAASSLEPSHVLSAIGLDAAAARSSLRFSLGRYTSSEDVHKTVDSLAKILA